MHMNGDRWFKELSKLYKVILIILPVVNYFIEIYTRICAFCRHKTPINFIAVILFVVPWGLALSYIDFVWVLIFDRQIFIP